MKLCVFDFDSTLMDGETIDTIAAACGKAEAVAQMTTAAMAGNLDFFEALTQRVALLSGVSYQQVQAICHNLPLMPGAAEVVTGLQQKGYKVVVFSGGFREATGYFREQLGIDADFANFLYQKNGVLTGQVGGEMMQNTSKGDMLVRLQRLLGVSIENTMAVGDGANDASMFPYAAQKVAFCAKPVLKAQANIIVDVKDLREILKIGA